LNVVLLLVSNDCCPGVSASDDVVEFKFVPFYCSQCMSTDRQQASSSQDPTQCYHCHSQTGSRTKEEEDNPMITV